MNAAEKYQAELVQSEKDHHTPTAGAMSGHILANLFIQRNKLRQANYYLKGTAKGVSSQIADTIKKEDELFDRLNQLLLDEGEVIPTTTAEFTRYTMLEESGQLKYETTENILFTAVQDFNTQNLFVTRGIKLAEKEEKFALVVFLQALYGWLKAQSRLFQSFIGHDALEGLLEEDEED